jgi:hypothetical protein
MGKSKISRIKSLEPKVNQRGICIIDIDDGEALVEQMELTDNETCRATHDDLIDALAQATTVGMIHFGSNEVDLDDYYDDEYEDEEDMMFGGYALN